MNLDPRKNPFLYRKDNDEVWTSGNVWVEVSYTEDVQLSRPDCYFETVEVRGRGSSVPGGLAKNGYCKECNLRERDEGTMVQRALEMTEWSGEDTSSAGAVEIIDH